MNTRIVGELPELTAQGVVEVVVPNLAAAVTFYGDIGFTVERETPSFVVLRYEETYLFLAQNADAPVTPRWTNVRIVVSNVDAVWRRVKERDLPIGSPIDDRPYGLRDFTVRDPAGFEVRFAQPNSLAGMPRK
jgi:catechol 2,3-dioxygenase-like lactoylglutathione lyase family enzyme